MYICYVGFDGEYMIYMLMIWLHFWISYLELGYIKINTYICIDGSPDENQTALDFTFHIVYATKFAPIL